MTQYALPIIDIDTSTWQEGAGDGDGDAFDELDEGFGPGRGSGSGPDDATTFWETTAEDAPSSIPLKTKLSSVTDPVGDTGHTYRSRNRKDSAAGRQIDITINLYSGATFIDNNLRLNVDNVWTTQSELLSAAKADTIGDYTDLRVWTRAVETGGGAPREGHVSAHEFECPDAGPPVGADEMMAAIGQQTGGGGGSGDIMAHSRKPPEVIAY